MDHFEEHLRTFRLAPPSAELDRLMDNAFERTADPGSAAPSWLRWWWLVLPVTGAVAAALLLTVRPRLAPAPPGPVVYQIEAQGRMREWLLAAPIKAQAPPVVLVSIRQ
jgi:hypothetical protein